MTQVVGSLLPTWETEFIASWFTLAIAGVQGVAQALGTLSVALPLRLNIIIIITYKLVR